MQRHAAQQLGRRGGLSGLSGLNEPWKRSLPVFALGFNLGFTLGEAVPWAEFCTCREPHAKGRHRPARCHGLLAPCSQGGIDVSLYTVEIGGEAKVRRSREFHELLDLNRTSRSILASRFWDPPCHWLGTFWKGP